MNQKKLSERAKAHVPQRLSGKHSTLRRWHDTGFHGREKATKTVIEKVRQDHRAYKLSNSEVKRETAKESGYQAEYDDAEASDVVGVSVDRIENFGETDDSAMTVTRSNRHYHFEISAAKPQQTPSNSAIKQTSSDSQMKQKSSSSRVCKQISSDSYMKQKSSTSRVKKLNSSTSSDLPSMSPPGTHRTIFTTTRDLRSRPSNSTNLSSDLKSFASEKKTSSNSCSNDRKCILQVQSTREKKEMALKGTHQVQVLSSCGNSMRRDSKKHVV
eukprot:CAMPEP_0167742748 /NCGR_PEP_ID=MMETSP0110_2-20121227/1614_1 /TAXON_ID=629695 /ORGANISM="Gymnochlora sp., Strain CCMP2014" /LENGTH=270 /DNA_ID=CAMNT_0007627005 /DNA_START=678 /DNA_END=1490 /DNA_ORIENTATION=+